MKKGFLLALGPLFLLSGCGGSKKNIQRVPYNTIDTQRENVVLTEFDAVEDDLSVRSFFDDGVSNDYYAESDFNCHQEQILIDSLYEDGPEYARVGNHLLDQKEEKEEEIVDSSGFEVTQVSLDGQEKNASEDELRAATDIPIGA